MADKPKKLKAGMTVVSGRFIPRVASSRRTVSQSGGYSSVTVVPARKRRRPA
jgi:hypothetical protein